MSIVIIILLLAASSFMWWKLRKRIILLRKRLVVMEREKQTMYNFLDRIGSKITMGTDPEEAIDIIVSFAQEATQADAAALFVRERDSTRLRARVVKGLFPPLHKVKSDRLFTKRKFVADLVRKTVIEEGEGIIGAVAATGETLFIANGEGDPRLRKLREAGIEVRDVIMVPLTVRDGILGVLALVNKRGDEHFSELDLNQVLGIADQAALTIDFVRLYEMKAEQQRLEQELELAKLFQNMLLPREKPDMKNIVLSEYYRPAREVGGDYFDYIKIDDRHVGIVVADVSGKGVPGALVMASVRATLRSEARMSLSPKHVLQKVNEQALRDTEDSVFITVAYGILDTVTGRFRFCRAGHEPVICCNVKEGSVLTYTPEGIALGIVSDELFSVTEEKEIWLSEQDFIVLYTDGVIEAMNADREEYGEVRLHQVLQENASESLGDLVAKVVDDIGEFTGELPQHDDITLVMLGWREDKESQSGAVVELKTSTA